MEDADVLGEGAQRNAYIFFYLRKNLCTEMNNLPEAMKHHPARSFRSDIARRDPKQEATTRGEKYRSVIADELRFS